MTTIASDGRTVAADGLATVGDEPVSFSLRKLARLSDGTIVGLGGSQRLFEPMIKWYVAGCGEDNLPKTTASDEFGFYVFLPDKVLCFNHGSPYPSVYGYPFAGGSGEDYASGAMAFGATPTQAVEIAAKFNVKTGGEILTFNIPQAVSIKQAAE